MRTFRCLVFLASSTLLGAPTHATDGVIEINQAKAIAGGLGGDVTADPPGFPVRITEPGSYQLTSDLDVTVVTLGGIEIADGVSDVTIDLGGFTIRGVSGVNVSPPLWQCTGGGGVGNPAGILAVPSAARARRVTVRNGRIRKMGGNGIDLGPASHVEHVQVEQNCGYGMLLDDQSQVLASQARANRFYGIFCGDSCRIVDSVASENFGRGIFALDGALISGSVARGNGDTGIVVSEGSRLAHNVAAANGAAATAGAGFALFGGSSNLSGSISNRNDVGVQAEASDGVGLSVIDLNTTPAAGSAPLWTGCNLISFLLVPSPVCP